MLELVDMIRLKFDFVAGLVSLLYNVILENKM